MPVSRSFVLTSAGRAFRTGDPHRPFRLNMLVLSPRQPGADPRPTTLKDRLLDQLLARCEPWDAASRQFLQRYFDYLQRQIERNLPSIEARLARFEGLYAAEDTFFSAPAPLPRAELILQDEEEPVIADFAFWLGGATTVALADPSRLPPAASRRRRSRLASAGLTVVHFSPGGPAAGDDAMFDALLGPEMGAFFQTEAVPCGPLPHDFPQAGFEAAQSAANKEFSS